MNIHLKVGREPVKDFASLASVMREVKSVLRDRSIAKFCDAFWAESDNPAARSNNNNHRVVKTDK